MMDGNTIVVINCKAIITAFFWRLGFQDNDYDNDAMSMMMMMMMLTMMVMQL